MSDDERQTFEQAMKSDQLASKLVGTKWYPHRYEAAFSQNTLHVDLGYLKQDFPSVYDLDEETRDRLIAHTRQDAALACVAIFDTRKQLQKLIKLVVLLTACNCLMLAVLLLR